MVGWSATFLSRPESMAGAGSLGYAQRLSDYPDKGKCGLPETLDDPRALASGLKRLVALVRGAASLVVLTGAGISRAAGIPDFRGPDGIWTREQEEKRARKRARPNGGGASREATLGREGARCRLITCAQGEE